MCSILLQTIQGNHFYQLIFNRCKYHIDSHQLCTHTHVVHFKRIIKLDGFIDSLQLCILDLKIYNLFSVMLLKMIMLKFIIFCKRVIYLFIFNNNSLLKPSYSLLCLQMVSSGSVFFFFLARLQRHLLICRKLCCAAKSF